MKSPAFHRSQKIVVPKKKIQDTPTFFSIFCQKSGIFPNQIWVPPDFFFEFLPKTQITKFFWATPKIFLGYSLKNILDTPRFFAKKICTKFGFFVRESSPNPLSPSGVLKIPRATRRALGIFKIPSGHRGSRRRFPPKNPNLLYKI